MVPCFAWKPQHIIECTLDCTTQFYRTTNGRLFIRRYHKTRTAALHAQRWDGAYSTDTVDSSVPAVAGGKTSAQVFVGVKSKCASVCGMHSVSEFPEALKEFTLDTGAPHTLISDNHDAETSEKQVRKLRKCKGSTASKEGHQNQRNKIKTSVSVTFRILSVTQSNCLIAQELQISYDCLPSFMSFWYTISLLLKLWDGLPPSKTYLEFHLMFLCLPSFISTNRFITLNMNTILSPLKKNCLVGG